MIKFANFIKKAYRKDPEDHKSENQRTAEPPQSEESIPNFSHDSVESALRKEQRVRRYDELTDKPVTSEVRNSHTRGYGYENVSEESSQVPSDRQFIHEQMALLEKKVQESEELFNGLDDEIQKTSDTTTDIFKSLHREERKRPLDKDKSSNLYEMSLSLAKEIHARAVNNETLKCQPVLLCVDALIEQLILNNKYLPLLMSVDAEEYISSHAINVTILSIKIGIGLQYDRDKLKEIAVPAFFHDIGMTKYMDLANQPRDLTNKEYEEIRKHPVVGAEILKKAINLPEIAIQAALQHHERIDGSGYPHGADDELLIPCTRVINLANTYEALTHSRPYRDRHEPFEAIKQILAVKNTYDYNTLKAFLNVVGIYPLGTMVRLNSGEIGKVIAINEGYPTRPVVRVMYNSENRKLEKTKTIDLLTHKIVYIKECLKKTRSAK